MILRFVNSSTALGSVLTVGSLLGILPLSPFLCYFPTCSLSLKINKWKKKKRLSLVKKKWSFLGITFQTNHDMEKEGESSGADGKMRYEDKELETLRSHSKISKKIWKEPFLLLKADSVPWTESSWSLDENMGSWKKPSPDKRQLQTWDSSTVITLNF